MVKWHRKYSISIIWIFLKISQYVLQKSEIKKTFSKKTDVIAKFLGSCSFLLYIIFCHKTHFIGKYSHSDLCHNGRKMKAKSHYAINKCPTVQHIFIFIFLFRKWRAPVINHILVEYLHTCKDIHNTYHTKTVNIKLYRY